MPFCVRAIDSRMPLHALDTEDMCPVKSSKPRPLLYFSFRMRAHKAEGSVVSRHPNFIRYAEFSCRILRIPSPPCIFSRVIISQGTRWIFLPMAVPPHKNRRIFLSSVSHSERGNREDCITYPGIAAIVDWIKVARPAKDKHLVFQLASRPSILESTSWKVELVTLPLITGTPR